MTSNNNLKKSNVIQFPTCQKEDDNIAELAEFYGLPLEEFKHLSDIMDALLELPDRNLSVLYRWLKGVVE